MIYGKLSDWRAAPGFLESPVWTVAFQWLETQAASAAEGAHPLGAEGFEARVMYYETKARELARFEAHRRAIDIQYTIEGAEAIETAPAELLRECGPYDEATDAQFFLAPAAAHARLENRQGFYTVLFPGEAHMPQLAIPGIKSVRKVVVKVPAALIARSLIRRPA